MTTYKGIRHEELQTIEVLRDGQLLSATPSQRLFNHSPDGFEWGYGGSGPAQLALALLLAEGVSSEQAVRLHQAFKQSVVSRLDRGGWELTSEQIQQWLADHPVQS